MIDTTQKPEKYFNELTKKINAAYKVANVARSKNKDPELFVEAVPAGDLAARVEGLVGPKGIADEIKSIGRENITKIIDSILDGKFGMDLDERIEQAVRTTLAILTEGVVAAPIEGIAKVEKNSNPDNTTFLSIYFSGPIRSAGGTAQGLAVLIAAYIQKRLKYEGFRPTEDIIQRYLEEIRLYNDTVTNLQYVPGDGEIRLIVENSGVCIDGEPTEKDKEVAVHRDVPGVHTNQIRGGMCLVIAEGMAQKAPKLIKKSAEFGIDWSFLEEVEKLKLGKKGKEEKGGEGDDKDDKKIKPIAKFMKETVGGRPIFAAPSTKGAFRLRYGRSRASGIAAKSIHPAAQVILGEFIATGTQLRVERPGKGCIITPCDTIEGPVVKLKNGSVVRVETVKYAREIKNEIAEILFLGDILVSYGDFLQTNNPLVPSGYCEEWWVQEVAAAGGNYDINYVPSPGEAIEISKKFNVPIHPHYTYHWEDITVNELKILVEWLAGGEVVDGVMTVATDAGAKRVLELLGIPHTVMNNFIKIEEYLILKNLFENENRRNPDNSSGIVNDANSNINNRHTKNNNDNNGDNTNSNSDNKYLNVGLKESKDGGFAHSDMVVGHIETPKISNGNGNHNDKEGVVKVANENNINKNESPDDNIKNNSSADNTPYEYKNNFAHNNGYDDQDECKSRDSRNCGHCGRSDNDYNNNFIDDCDNSKYNSAYEFLSKNSGIKIRKKVGNYVGARMGRPEKAKERKMQPAVHSLFPISDAGKKERSLNVAAEKTAVSLEVPRYECECGAVGIFTECDACGRPANLRKICPNRNCGKIWDTDRTVCPSCKTRLRNFERRDIDIRNLWAHAVKNINATGNVKAVKGMISAEKIPEHIEKGILRAKNEVYVFKDGTIRFDATDAPVTHFKPKEVDVSIEYLKKLGYTHDYNGNELTDENQILELEVQDIIIPYNGAEYFMRTAKFVDELLRKFYGLENFYNIRTKEDLLGVIVVGLAPHTSAGIMGRIIGFTPARVCYAHPYWHAAKRRNCFSGDTKIPILKEGEWNIITIKELVEKNLIKIERDDFGCEYSKVDGIKTLTFNKESKKFEVADISHVSRHVPQETITLKTKSGRMITTTLDHPFPTINGKEIASDVEEVFVPHNIDIPEGKNKKRILNKLIKNCNEKAQKFGDIFIDKIINKKLNNEKVVTYSLTVPPHNTIIANGIVSHQCDGDEDTVMLLMDVILNFSRKFLPQSRGGKMDAPLVITTLLDPKEVDDEAHKMEIVDNYSLNFYEKTQSCVNPGDKSIMNDIKIVDNTLNTNPYSNLRFTHDTGDITGPVLKSRYVVLDSMVEKVDAQLFVAEKVRAIDERKVAEILINSHFLRDTYGNLRAFSRQKFRCVKCNQSYRRVPLVGKCTKCGGRLLLTVTEGSVRKYLGISTNMANKYNLSDYLKQRLMLLDQDIKSLFVNDLSKQASLSDFM